MPNYGKLPLVSLQNQLVHILSFPFLILIALHYNGGLINNTMRRGNSVLQGTCCPLFF